LPLKAEASKTVLSMRSAAPMTGKVSCGFSPLWCLRGTVGPGLLARCMKIGGPMVALPWPKNSDRSSRGSAMSFAPQPSIPASGCTAIIAWCRS
jgi:hypothetical protein